MKEQINQRKRQMIGLRIDQGMQQHGLTNEEVAEKVHLFPPDISQVRKGDAWWLTHDHLRDFAEILHLREDRGRKAIPLSDEAVEKLFLAELPDVYKY